MFRLLLLCAFIGLLFWLLPVGPAAVWSIIPGFLLIGAIYDTLRRGRILLNRRRNDGAVDEATNLAGHFLILQAFWLGLHAPAPDSITGAEGIGGDLEFTGYDGGHDGGYDGGYGGGSDAGAGGDGGI